MGWSHTLISCTWASYKECNQYLEKYILIFNRTGLYFLSKTTIENCCYTIWLHMESQPFRDLRDVMILQSRKTAGFRSGYVGEIFMNHVFVCNNIIQIKSSVLCVRHYFTKTVCKLIILIESKFVFSIR